MEILLIPPFVANVFTETLFIAFYSSSQNSYRENRKSRTMKNEDLGIQQAWVQLKTLL